MTQDTGAEALSERHQRFIGEYLRTGNASQAARSAGFAARSGASLLETPPIKLEIEKRRAQGATETPGKGDLESLIGEADEAIRIAKEANNAAGVVAAIQLKARLLGVLQGNELAQGSEAQAAEPTDLRGLTLGVVSLLRESAMNPEAREDIKVLIRFLQRIVGEGADPMESLNARGWPHDNQHVQGLDKLASSSEVNPPAAAETAPILGESECFDNSASITLVEVAGSGERKWLILDQYGVEHGYRRDRTAAAELAQSIGKGVSNVVHIGREQRA